MSPKKSPKKEFEDENNENALGREGLPTNQNSIGLRKFGLFTRDTNIMPDATPSPTKKSPSKKSDYISVETFLFEYPETHKVVDTTIDMLKDFLELMQKIRPNIKDSKLNAKALLCIDDINELLLNLNNLLQRGIESLTKSRTAAQFNEDVMVTLKHLKNCVLFRSKGILSEINPLVLKEYNLEKYQNLFKTIPKDFSLQVDILFSQKNATDTFKASHAIGTSSTLILGKKIRDVGEEIQNGTLDPDCLKVRIFRHKNRWVAENNRGFSAACISNIFPNRILPTFPEQLILNAYEEKLSKLIDKPPPTQKQISPPSKSEKKPTSEEILHSIDLINDKNQVSLTVSSLSKTWENVPNYTIRKGLR